MIDQASGTLARQDKGPLAPPPSLRGPAQQVARTVADWPGVAASTHWNLFRPMDVDGVDFYVGDAELGHIHLDGTIHLATPEALGEAMIAEGKARPFPYQAGWVQFRIADDDGIATGLALFGRNYARLTAMSS